MPPSRARRAARSPRAAAAQLAQELDEVAMILLLDADTDDDELDALVILALADQARQEANYTARWGARGSYDMPKCTQFFDLLFNAWSERKFKSWIRMSRPAFEHVVELIQGDPVFKSSGRKPQKPVRQQLATFLAKFGGDNTLHAATVAGVSEGSAYNFCNRVIHAVRNVRDQFVSWPEDDERERVKAAFEENNFPGCVGLIDGSLIRLADKPLVNPYAYWTRKKFYGIALQTVCDHRGRFTEYETGWPGCISDVTLLKESHMWKNKPRYFTEDEYLLADKGYPLTKHSIRPFGEHEMPRAAAESRRRKKFNYKLSAVRIEVEHAFGRLKGRFPVLQEFPGRSIHQIYRTLEALLIIHNMLVDFGDREEDIADYEFNGNDNLFEAGGRAEGVRAAGVTRRLALLDHVVPR